MISEDTLQIISKIFCGDIEGYYSYKSGPKLVSFFNQHFGYSDVYRQGFPSRWAYTYDKLADLINSGRFDTFLNLILSKEYIMQDKGLSQVDAAEHSYNTFEELNRVVQKDLYLITHTNGKYHLCAENQDLILIGEAVACITGKPLDEAVQERVIEPLGLGQSGYARVSRGGLSGDVASTALCSWRGYRVKGVVHNEDSFMMDGVAGHTGIFATAEDVVKLVNNYLAAVHGTPGLVSVETAREMIRKQAADAQTGTNRRGLLWQLRTPDVNDATFPTGLKSFGHTGWTGTMVWADVERDMVFAILTNDIYLPQAERTLWSRRKSMVEYIIEAIDRG